jgi:hypothetical protein
VSAATLIRRSTARGTRAARRADRGRAGRGDGGSYGVDVDLALSQVLAGPGRRGGVAPSGPLLPAASRSLSEAPWREILVLKK